MSEKGFYRGIRVHKKFDFLVGNFEGGLGPGLVTALKLSAFVKTLNLG